MPKRKLGWRKTPKYECVGCGYCCLAVPCFHSAKKNGPQIRCPDLKWDDEKKRYICKEYLHSDMEWLIGVGCPSNLNSWRQDVKFRG
jgi:Fe-S-cluster-containing dehydrogenase component